MKLLRTRSARDFSWGFIAMNFVGITFLALRSGELQEWGFVFANVSTAAFWLLAGVIKTLEGTGAPAPAAAATAAMAARK